MVEKYGDTQGSAGWVWAIVGIIVAALIVWWIAAAVSNNQRHDTSGALSEQTVGATTPSGETSGARDLPAGVLPSGGTQQAGVGYPAEVQAFNDWAQQDHGDWSAASVEEGMARLNQATDAILNRYAPPSAAQSAVGGGPQGTLGDAVSTERGQFKESIDKLNQARAANDPVAFQAAASDFATLAEGIRAEGGIAASEKSVKDLREDVSKIDANKPLSEQSDDVQGFFEQSATVLTSLAQNTHASEAGEGAPAESPTPNDATR